MLKWIEIDRRGIKANARAIKRELRPGVKFMAVVKADGYGHGAAEAARAALAGGADQLGVLTAEEGARLREAGVKAPIACLAPSLPEEAGEIVKHRLIPTVDSLPFVKAFARRGSAARPLPCRVDIDLGLRRWGVAPGALPAFAAALARVKAVRPLAFSAHLAYTPQKNLVEAEEKLGRFRALALAARRYWPGLEADAANSSVFCDLPHWQLDMVRIGNLLYGIYPSNYYLKKKGGPPVPGLERPWKFFARIISIKKVRRGESLGYSSEYVAPRDMRVATIPAGYSDGLSMEPRGGGIRVDAGFTYWGTLRGRKAPFIGRPGIIHTLLDVSAIPGAAAGDPVALHSRRTAANARLPRLYK
ncbi:MAG: alr2 [Elusimicrobia bacterium]|nr:MAG: alr2 [Elusimicrobiota bacterium]KAF0155066.1 MAG: alr2 [Elusimicrobiota bacterium]